MAITFSCCDIKVGMNYKKYSVNFILLYFLHIICGVVFCFQFRFDSMGNPQAETQQSEVFVTISSKLQTFSTVEKLMSN